MRIKLEKTQQIYFQSFLFIMEQISFPFVHKKWIGQLLQFYDVLYKEFWDTNFQNWSHELSLFYTKVIIIEMFIFLTKKLIKSLLFKMR